VWEEENASHDEKRFMLKSTQIWNKEEIARERLRALFVIAVVGIVAAARYFKILESFTMRFELMDWVNVFDILIAFWIAYLVSMVFAISDDLFGFALGSYGRAFSFGAKIFGRMVFVVGPFFTLFAAVWVGLLKDPFRTVVYLVLLVVVLFLLRRPVTKWFASDTKSIWTMEASTDPRY
jgi:hypothetical protein